jgi:hypothetical protein
MEEKCCVCGQTTNDLDTYISPLTKEPKVYCFNCILSGFEPYEDLVNFGWEYGMFNKIFQQKKVLPTISLNGKTIKQFNEDVNKKRDEQENGSNE